MSGIQKNRNEKENKAGRPTPYKAEYSEQAFKLCLLGATDKDLADFFDVTETTINNWKIKHSVFFESIKKGKVVADSEIASKLFQRAKGYEHKGIDIKMIKGKIVKTPIIKHFPPDVTAAIFWLKNRSPKNWRDKVDTELNIKGNTNIPIQKWIDDNSED